MEILAGVFLFFQIAPYFIPCYSGPGAGNPPLGTVSLFGVDGRKKSSVSAEGCGKKHSVDEPAGEDMNNKTERIPAQIPSMRFGLATATKGTV